MRSWSPNRHDNVIPAQVEFRNLVNHKALPFLIAHPDPYPDSQPMYHLISPVQDDGLLPRRLTIQAFGFPTCSSRFKSPPTFPVLSCTNPPTFSAHRNQHNAAPHPLEVSPKVGYDVLVASPTPPVAVFRVSPAPSPMLCTAPPTVEVTLVSASAGCPEGSTGRIHNLLPSDDLPGCDVG